MRVDSFLFTSMAPEQIRLSPPAVQITREAPPEDFRDSSDLARMSGLGTPGNAEQTLHESAVLDFALTGNSDF